LEIKDINSSSKDAQLKEMLIKINKLALSFFHKKLFESDLAYKYLV
jgi:hypothetical protein